MGSGEEAVAPKEKCRSSGQQALASLALALLLGSALNGATLRAESSPAETGPATDPGAAPANPPDSASLRVLFTGETRGNLLPCECPDRPWGGLARRVGFLREARRAHPQALTLAIDTGGFLPVGETPLRDRPSAAHRLSALLLRSFDRAGVDVVSVNRAESRFLQHLVPAEIEQLGARIQVSDDPALPRWWDWGGRRVAVLALSDALPDSLIRVASAPVRRAAAVFIVAGHADAIGGRRLAELSGADLVILSRGARPPQPLRQGDSWLVGAGAHGRETGEVVLAWGTDGVFLRSARHHPMDDAESSDPLTEREVRTLLDEEGAGWQALISAEGPRK